MGGGGGGQYYCSYFLANKFYALGGDGVRDEGGEWGASEGRGGRVRGEGVEVGLSDSYKWKSLRSFDERSVMFYFI